MTPTATNTVDPAAPGVVGRLVPWALRAAWAAVAVAAGPLFAAALDGWDTPARTVAAAGLWAAWAAGMLAVLVPHPASLTAVRVVTPAAVAAAALAALQPEPGTAERLAGLVLTVVAAGVAFLPEIGAHFVNGPAYPNERRLPLRVPAPLLFGPVPLAWIVTAGGPVVAALLLADGRWAAGAVATVLGGGGAIIGGRALHRLSRRWVVFVPAGLVLHDHMVLADPVLFERKVIESLHAAPVNTDSLDLTANAPGLPLELVLKEKVPMARVRPRQAPETGSSARLLFSPTRPGEVLLEAARRRIPTG